MKAKQIKVLAAGMSLLIMTGCGAKENSSNASVTKVESNDFLDVTSDAITTQGKWDFESLRLDEDEFTKEATYSLPKSELPKIALNDIVVEFFLHRSSDDEEFMPTMNVSYGGDDWLFMDSTIVKIGDDVLTINPVQDPMRDTLNSGGVFEYLVFELNKESVNFLGTSKSNADLDVRMNAKYNEDIKLTGIEYKGMKKIISAYRYYLTTLK